MMSFDMSAVGITLTILLAGILAAGGFGLWVLLGRRHWLAWAIGAVVGGLASVPLIEEVVIATRFERLCRDAGVHVVKTVEVKGFYDATMRSGYELIERGDYKFMEHRSKTLEKIERVERVAGGWKVTVLDRPTARYHYKHAYQPTPYRTEEALGWKILKSETIVLDSITGETLGRDTRFVRSPSVADGLWIHFLDHGRSGCSGPLNDPTRQSRTGLLYKYVLIPENL